MARKNDSILRALFDYPWWVSILISIFSYVLLKEILPSALVNMDNSYSKMVADGITQGLSAFAPIVAIVLLLPAPFSFLRAFRLKQRYKTTSTKNDLNGLNWIEFEALLGEYYRQQGYQVKQALNHQPDGGVDIELTKFGKVSLVQCKHWKSRKVGVKVLRELYGILLDRQAEKMIVATSSEFTLDAQRFAKGKQFELINGAQLVLMLYPEKPLDSAISSTTEIRHSKLEINATIICPRCNSNLVLRTAKKGINAGMPFYGCSEFPRCRYTQPK